MAAAAVAASRAPDTQEMVEADESSGTVAITGATGALVARAVSRASSPAEGAPARVPALAELDRAFADFLRLDVANGDASPDTIRGYRTQVAAWIAWCGEHARHPGLATVDDVKAYRQDLVARGYKRSSIAHKLVILRRFYRAAVDAGLRPDNPAAGVRPPREKRALEDFGYLTEVELTLLLRAVPKEQAEKALRDRALLALFGLQGLRTVEIERANADDLQQRGDGMALLVRGKTRDRLAHLRPDVANALAAYLAVRGPVAADARGTPLFTAVGNFAGGQRLGRRGLRKTVDGYLRAAGAKRPGVSDHALRHTAATLAYQYSHDLRAVQDMLGHADPKTTARYARVVDMAKANPALTVPVKL
jgi:site-specific recombinase XerD